MELYKVKNKNKNMVELGSRESKYLVSKRKLAFKKLFSSSFLGAIKVVRCANNLFNLNKTADGFLDFKVVFGSSLCNLIILSPAVSSG